MAKTRGRVHHGAKGQVWRDALLHPRSRWLHYRSWAKQAGRYVRLRLSPNVRSSSVARVPPACRGPHEHEESKEHGRGQQGDGFARALTILRALALIQAG